jgi:hypothetical protein
MPMVTAVEVDTSHFSFSIMILQSGQPSFSPAAALFSFSPALGHLTAFKA